MTPDAAAGNPRVALETTAGRILVELDMRAKNSVENFLSYVDSGHYDGTIFHRVIKGFVIQGGGFDEKMKQKKTKSPIKLEIVPGLKHTDGALSMARTSDPNSATAQFYICDGAQPGLDGQYAVFGKVVDGWDVVSAIAKTQTDRQDVPKRAQVITSAKRV